MIGKVISSAGGIYTIYVDGITYNVFAKGIFKFQNKKLFVGDNVSFNHEKLIIDDIFEYKNELIRPKIRNIDQLFIVMSLRKPDFSLKLLFKYMTYVLKNNIKPIIIFTKTDLLENDDDIKYLKNILDKINIESFFVNKYSSDDINKLKNKFNDKVNVFMGQTGVGKSSLINAVDPKFSRTIGSYSEALGRGKHQTKEVILLPYMNGFIADTPGFSCLDLDLYKEDLAQFFPGFNDLYKDCFFSNCLHLNEKKCNVKNAIENGQISEDSYKVYVELLDELIYKNRRFD